MDTAAHMVAAFTSLEYGMVRRHNGGFVSDSQMRYTSRQHFNNAKEILEGLLRTAKTETERRAISATIRLAGKFERNLRR